MPAQIENNQVSTSLRVTGWVLSRGFMMSARLLTIVTVCLDDADRLSRTIQSMSDFYGDARYEHIVVDGGSVDHTRRVVAPLMTVSNFRFESGNDEGIYDAMNGGVDRSSGKYLLFLNCGDCMLATPDELANCLNSVECSNEVDILCFAFRQVGNDSRIKNISPEEAKPHRLPTSHQGMIFAARFLSMHRYDTRYRIAADYDLYLHADPARIMAASMRRPLSAVEVHGVASENPLASYREYIYCAARNLQGMKRLLALTRIGFRAAIVVPLKLILPTRWVASMRGV